MPASSSAHDKSSLALRLDEPYDSRVRIEKEQPTCRSGQHQGCCRYDSTLKAKKKMGGRFESSATKRTDGRKTETDRRTFWTSTDRLNSQRLALSRKSTMFQLLSKIGFFRSLEILEDSFYFTQSTERDAIMRKIKISNTFIDNLNNFFSAIGCLDWLKAHECLNSDAMKLSIFYLKKTLPNFHSSICIPFIFFFLNECKMKLDQAGAGPLLVLKRSMSQP